MTVQVTLQRRVERDDAEAADDLGVVGRLLRSKNELWEVSLPVGVEDLEHLGREANRGGRRKVELVRVEEREK